MNRISLSLLVFAYALALQICDVRTATAQVAVNPNSISDSNPDRGQQLAQETLSRLLSVAGRPEHAYGSWPPAAHVLQPNSGNQISEGIGEYNAFATAPKCLPYIAITEGLMSDIAQYQPDRVAFIMGHELSHLLLGHVQCTDQPAQTGLVQIAFTRQQEYDADRNGMMLALRAGYSGPEALASFRIMDEILGGSSFEALGQNHPSFKDRLAQLDASQATLWRSMGAFDNGAYFLALEQYGAAEDCFKRVTDEFPDAVEAWVNLGYARLMRYADGLSTEDVKNLGIGQLAVGAFYTRPDSLRSKVRGLNGTLWNSAVEALENANRINPNLALVNEGLGMAYLVHPSGSPQLDRAIPHLEQALTLAGKENSLDIGSQTAIRINLAVGYAAAGKAREANGVLQSAAQQIAAVKNHSLADFIGAAAIYYNAAMLDSGNSGTQAADEFEHYLAMTNPNSAWWPIAYERYQQVASAAGLQPKPATGFQNQLQSIRRPLVALDLGNEQRVTIGEGFDKVRAALGPGDEVPIAGKIKQVRYPQRGLALAGDSQVLAIILNDRTAPDLPIRSFGSAQSEEHLRVGMPLQDLAQLLPNQPYAVVPLLDFQTPYVFFPAMGLAISGTPDNMVKELVIAQIPVPSKQ